MTLEDQVTELKGGIAEVRDRIAEVRDQIAEVTDRIAECRSFLSTLEVVSALVCHFKIHMHYGCLGPNMIDTANKYALCVVAGR